jgi:hypothetical protein
MNHRCLICRRSPGNLGGRFCYCVDCIEAIQRARRCPDCDSDATVLVTEGSAVLDFLIRHDDTCPTWQAIRRDAS